MTRRLMDGAEARGWRLNTPTQDTERGGSVVIDVPNGAAVTDELLKRGGDRRSPAQRGHSRAPHFYTTEAEIDRALETIDEIQSRMAS
jgi:kynureninase